MRRFVFVSVSVMLAVSCATSQPMPDSPPLKRIALSFDDAPMNDTAITSGTERTQKLLKALASVDAGANPTTFTHLAIDETLIDAFLADRGVFGPIESSE